MARPENRSEPKSFSITVPAQTFEYLVKLASAGALGQSEQAVAAALVVNEVERLIREMRADYRP